MPRHHSILTPSHLTALAWAWALGGCLLLAGTARAGERQVVRGQVPAAVAHLQPVRPLAQTNRLELTLALPLRNPQALSGLLQQLYDPASTNYHRYLTPQQFADCFAPAESDYQALIAFARANGLAVTGTHPNRTLLDVAGSVGAIEKTFHLTLRVYRHPTEPRTFYAPDTEPSLDLAVPILSISGLDDFTLPEPMDLRWRSEGAHPGTAPLPRTVGDFRNPNPNLNPNLNETPYTTGSGPRGCFLGRDFRAAYAPGVELDGAGEAVGLFELDGYYLSDVLAYEALAGLPNVPLVNVLVNGFSGQPGSHNVEVALDIDMALSMAPGLSQILVYEGTSVNDVLNRMATDNLARQLSCSWGFGKRDDPARDQIYLQFAAQGQAMFQASGDYGAWIGTIMAPSDNPWVTVVGGTSLTTSGAGGDWLSETTWSGSGGGISTSFPIPYWQQGLDMSASQGSTSMRNIPDVAALADGIWLYAFNGQQGVVGGTSAAAPLWAGFAALVNQQAALQGKPAVGFFNPALYAIGKSAGAPAAFHDITTGNNTNSSSPAKFLAVPGFDLCTGWGTPAGSNLITALLAPPDPLLLSTPAGLTFRGGPGGPFSPSVQLFVLTNSSAVSLDWAVSNTVPWLEVSPAGGTLDPGGPAATVTATLTALAINQPPGSYPATLSFTNFTTRSAQNRQVTLNVLAPPEITAQPANQAVLEGMSATFSVGTAPNAELAFQWRQDNGISLMPLTDGGNISGASTPTLTLTNVSPANVGAYSVVVSNSAGVVTSSNGFLALVPWRPQITAQPTNQTALPGQNVTISVTAIGAGPLFYRWQLDGADLTDTGNISGASTSTLTLTSVSAANAGTYSVIVGNGYGLVSSSPALLTVVPVTAPGTTLSVLHSFAGPAGGAHPNGLARGADGVLYGTTQHGGANGAGTVFRMPPGGDLASLYSFTGGSDGANPFAAPALGPDGNLYGTTLQGGTNDAGTLFRITPQGALTTLVNLKFALGELPYAALTLGADGSFYGTASQGGASSYGTVFRLGPDGAFNTLCSFNNGSAGGELRAPVVQGPDGALYGTAFQGGANAKGSVFKVTTYGALVGLVSFNGTNGCFPYAGLARDTDGNFYGATSAGGASNNGTLFRMSPEGMLTTLYSFTGGDDGAGPAAGLLLADDGNFYGTTAYGGPYGAGTVFRLAPGGAPVTLLAFDGYQGANPQAALAQGADGYLYGTTRNGGAGGDGVIFRLGSSGPPQITSQPAAQTAFTGATVLFSVAVCGTPPLSCQWLENGTNLLEGGNLSGTSARVLVLTNITSSDVGSYSVFVSNALGWVRSDEALLQVTSSPPVIVTQPTNLVTAPGAEALFRVGVVGNLPLSYQWQQNGTNLADGGNISGAGSSILRLANATEADNAIYSVFITNSLGSATSTGAVLTVVPVSASGTRLATLHWFDGATNGATPNGLLQATNGLLYGTTASGGEFGAGTVFQATTDGVFTTLAAFALTNGANPRAALVQGADGNFYGTTASNGPAGAGTVFTLSPAGTLSTLFPFSGDEQGGNPLAALVQGTDGAFYGSTSLGGSSGYGTLFRITAAGALTSLYSFTNDPDGAFPADALLLAADGNFYGTTPAGGDQGQGSLFRLSSDGTFTNLYSFAGLRDGGTPVGALVQDTDGYLYGAAKSNIVNRMPLDGEIFKASTNGTCSFLYWLNTYDGHVPAAGLVRGGDGNFYGTTYYDGINNNGVVYRVTPSGAYTTLVNFDGFDDGAHPAAALVQGADACFYGTTTTGGLGGQGTIFRLSVAPQLLAPLTNLTVLAGTTVAFNAGVFGSRPLSCQWLKDGAALSDGGNISGSASTSLTLRDVTAADAGAYSLLVTNIAGSVASPAATLTIVPMPEFVSISYTNDSLTLAWCAATGQKYQLQYKTDLAAPTWSNLGGPLTATNTTASASDAILPNSHRFYRVQWVP